MFENTLMIIKPDFMCKRKVILTHLLSSGFLLQGSRKLVFSPENAAEFYKGMGDRKFYMLYVILLSKGTSEAFILRKDNAAEELNQKLICYFNTSEEMNRNVHVSENATAAQREIQFIFPNYIPEPFEAFDTEQFLKQPIVASLLSEVFNIVKKPCENDHEYWRYGISNWLLATNAINPEISNQCSDIPNFGVQTKSQQTDLTMADADESAATKSVFESETSTPSGATSNVMSSSSCISCSSFETSDRSASTREIITEFGKRLQTRATKTVPLPIAFTEVGQSPPTDNTDSDNVSSVYSMKSTSSSDRFVYRKYPAEACTSKTIVEYILASTPGTPPSSPLSKKQLTEEHPPTEGQNIMATSESKMETKQKDNVSGEPLECAAEPFSGTPDGSLVKLLSPYTDIDSSND